MLIWSMLVPGHAQLALGGACSTQSAALRTAHGSTAVQCRLVRHALDTAQTQAARLELGRAYQDAAAFVAELLGQAWQEPAAQGSTSSAKSHTSLSSAKNDAAGPAATAPEAAAVVRDVASIFGGPRQGNWTDGGGTESWKPVLEVVCQGHHTPRGITHIIHLHPDTPAC
jgi:hypothetical protein